MTVCFSCLGLTLRKCRQWKGYVSYASRSSQEEHDEESAAGTMCHRESAFLQEIAMEAAMSERQNVWIDGSLSNGPWFSMVSQSFCF